MSDTPVRTDVPMKQHEDAVRQMMADLLATHDRNPAIGFVAVTLHKDGTISMPRIMAQGQHFALVGALESQKLNLFHLAETMNAAINEANKPPPGKAN